MSYSANGFVLTEQYKAPTSYGEGGPVAHQESGGVLVKTGVVEEAPTGRRRLRLPPGAPTEPAPRPGGLKLPATAEEVVSMEVDPSTEADLMEAEPGIGRYAVAGLLALVVAGGGYLLLRKKKRKQ